MSLPWVKLHTSLLDNDRFKLLTPEGKLTFYTAIALAGKLDSDGALIINGWGPMRAANVASYTSLDNLVQTQALEELAKVGLLVVDQETLRVAKWDEKCGNPSHLTSQRKRQKTYRERKRRRCVVDASSPKSLPVVIPVVATVVEALRDDSTTRHTVTDIDKDKDVDSEETSSPPPTLSAAGEAPAQRPKGDAQATDHRNRPLPLDLEERERAKALCKTVWGLMGGLHGMSFTRWTEAGNKQPALDMAVNGVTVAQVETAWKSATARMGEPVFTMKKVQEEIGRLALVPVRRVTPTRGRPAQENDRGAEMDAKISEIQQRAQAG